MNRFANYFLLASAFIGLSFVVLNTTPQVFASRNSGGTYSLPAGNPVVTGTTISTTWANNTLNDVATETTNSLDRNGRGGMLAPLALSNGTSGAPSLTFTSEPTSGLYRAASNDLRMQVASTYIQKWSATGTIIPGVGANTPLTVTAVSGTTNAVIATGSAGGSGAVLTGGITGAGVSAQGGATSGPGVYSVAGGGNSNGVITTGSGSASGINATGGATGPGGTFLAGGGTASGVNATGTGGGAGVAGTGGPNTAGGYFVNGTAATASTRQDAIQAVNGDVDLDGVAYPTSTVAIKNRLTPGNFIRVQGSFTDNGTNTPATTGAFNVSSVAQNIGGPTTVTFAQAFSATTYTVVVSSSCVTANSPVAFALTKNTGTLVLTPSDSLGLASRSACNNATLDLMIIGPQ